VSLKVYIHNVVYILNLLNFTQGCVYNIGVPQYVIRYILSGDQSEKRSHLAISVHITLRLLISC